MQAVDTIHNPEYPQGDVSVAEKLGKVALIAVERNEGTFPANELASGEVDSYDGLTREDELVKVRKELDEIYAAMPHAA
jgi:hypothetical protein